MATVTRQNLEATANLSGGISGIDAHRFADAVVAGDLPMAIALVPAESREIAAHLARASYGIGFAVALLAAATMAAIAAIAVGTLMRKRQP